MKTKLAISIITVFLFMVGTSLYGQATGVTLPWDDLTHFMDKANALTVVLITLAGYLTWIPIVNKIPAVLFRVIAMAVLIIGAGVSMGWISLWEGIIDFGLSTSIYQVILEGLFRFKTAKEMPDPIRRALVKSNLS